MKKFSGPRVTTGCALFIIIIMSGSGLYSAGYSKLAETFHTSMSHLGFYSMLLTISGIICSVSLTSLKQKITLKGVLTLDALVLYAVALCAKLLGDQLLTLLVFFISVGTTLSLGAHVVMTEIISNWYVEKRAEKISLMLGCALIGQALYQSVGGYVFSHMELLDGWFLLYLVNGTLLLLINHFLIIATDPKDVGQEAFGIPATVDSAESAPTCGEAHCGLYRRRAFWLCLLGDWGLSGGVNFITTYATTFFARNGISLQVSAAILSCATISAAIFSFLNGRFLKWLKVKKYVALLLGSVILGNLMMIVYGILPQPIIIALIILFYGIGYSGAHCINIVSGIIFSAEDAADANSKISGLAMSGGLLLLSLSGYLVDHVGFAAVYLVIIALAVISLISYELALSVSPKEQN